MYNGQLACVTKNYSQAYPYMSEDGFISKGTLENVIVGKELENKVNDVQINGTTILDENKIANIPFASTSQVGVLKPAPTYGITNDSTGGRSNGILMIVKASNEEISTRITNPSALHNYRPIVPANLDYAVRSVRPEVLTTLSGTAQVNKIYDLGEQTTLSITLPQGQVGDFIEIDFLCGPTPTNLSITSAYGMSEVDIVPEANTGYCLYCSWAKLDSSTYGWVIKSYDFVKATI